MDKPTIIKLDHHISSADYFQVFAHLPGACFLDSRHNSSKISNRTYDIIVAFPTITLEVTSDKSLQVTDHIKSVSYSTEATSTIAVMQKILNQMQKIPSLPEIPFVGGFIGYWAYEFACLLENKLQNLQLEPNSYLVRQGLYHWAIIVDYQNGTTKLILHPQINTKLKQQVISLLSKKLQQPQKTPFKLNQCFNTTITFADYQHKFHQVKQHIKQGDCYQINLTQKFFATYQGDCWTAYKHLRNICFNSYSGYLNYADEQILCNSPEQFINIKEHIITTSPIKGTKKRSSNPDIDQQYKLQLQQSSKDRAENLMIVDLMRNDLGKICKIGSINVPELFTIKSYTNVHHLVSKITGELLSNYNAIEALTSCFPGGSITGAPKIKSMEIINDIEDHSRNIFCGSIGYISCCGNMDTNICIRTLMARNNSLSCWAGGAIVADSNCDSEYQESLIKVSHLLNALENEFYHIS
jgi:para-aminobenzoate synthetase component 1